MNTIWKFPISLGHNKIKMPFGAEILSVDVQADQPCVWALVESDNSPEPRTVNVYGTGHPMRDLPGRFIGTFMLQGGSLVFHVFEP